MDENIIGLSLSQCVADMIEGHVDPNSVLFIYATDGIWNFPMDLEDAALCYGKKEWAQDPDLGRSLLFDLWEEGRIIQPRILRFKPCIDDPDSDNRAFALPDIRRGHWAIQVRMP